jgi:predicted nuclease of predicted toxin-antitoxin system
MPELIRFHLDENANNAIADGLRRRGIDVTVSVQANLISATDREQLAYAHAQGRVIFTQDRDFLELHYSGVKHSGIVYAIKGSRTTGEILRNLILIWEVLTPDDMIGNLEYL